MNETNREDALTRALRRLKEEDEGMSASHEVEARLLNEVRAIGRQRRRWNFTVLIGLAAAAMVVLAVSLTWLMDRGPIPDPNTGPSGVTQIVAEEVTEFFPLFYGSVPASQSHIVRMEVPRAALARFGLASADGIDGTTGMVLADVLIGDDGLARAVRFVRKL